LSDDEKSHRGAPLGNANAAKKPEIWFPENLEYLNNSEDVLAFQKRVIHALYTGKLGARQAGAINHGLETLLRFYLDSKKLSQYEEYFQRIKTLLDKDEAEQKTEVKPP
jgi:hypothetical protein